MLKRYVKEQANLEKKIDGSSIDLSRSQSGLRHSKSNKMVSEVEIGTPNHSEKRLKSPVGNSRVSYLREKLKEF